MELWEATVISLKSFVITSPGVLTHFLPGSARLRDLAFAETPLSAISGVTWSPDTSVKTRIQK